MLVWFQDIIVGTQWMCLVFVLHKLESRYIPLLPITLHKHRSGAEGIGHCVWFFCILNHLSSFVYYTFVLDINYTYLYLFLINTLADE